MFSKPSTIQRFFLYWSAQLEKEKIDYNGGHGDVLTCCNDKVPWVMVMTFVSLRVFKVFLCSLLLFFFCWSYCKVKSSFSVLLAFEFWLCSWQFSFCLRFSYFGIGFPFVTRWTKWTNLRSYGSGPNYVPQSLVPIFFLGSKFWLP